MSWRIPAVRDVGYPAPEALVARREGAASMQANQPVADGAVVADATVGGVACLIVQPEAPSSTILYLHGGGYRLGTPSSWTSFASRLAVAAEAKVVVADYRLAPEHPFPAALHDATAVYDALAGEGGPLIVMGDSAGGGLAASLVVACLASDAVVPDALVVMSPWVDLTVTNDTFATRAQSDQLFPRSSADEAADAYLQGAEAKDPFASPLFADLAGFPPALVFAGGSETLLGDGLGLTVRLAEAGVSVKGHFPSGMQHVWPTLFPDLPESADAFAAIVQFVGGAVAAHGAAGERA
jgi:monoterpene epsilon-lactone hydrolase